MSGPGAVDPGLDAVNSLPAETVQRRLLDCCASPDWATAVTGRRPFAGRTALAAAADEAFAGLPWPEVERALAAHPRIGERPSGGGRDAGWSAGEQSGVDGTPTETRAALAAGNAAYEARFGHLYLVCATGRSAADLLALLRSRLDNDPSTERAVVREELRKIARLRLDKLLAEPAAERAR